ncbi:CHASE2 domain-containing protein [aff. Roholtiella sp. LEGE 12411]|uniref:CHASE2 domain-containing protein n=1 Tax=aff. Roholtiella sp. LEGE 12411 TaxID=1828822 RepID=UPI001880716A|nr:CHASE2 domain-containing protein [aff. Roholtiella sp. LEGE 12411]MBE9035032.1 CHASE2 domain-containing protein [aff. Roholtiella sp. LEGE 12411]
MQKLVVLKLDGNLSEGVKATLEIGGEGDRATTEIRGYLTPKPELITHYNLWRATYRGLENFRITPINISIASTRSEQVKNCRKLGENLSEQMNSWLNCESFRPLKEKLLKQLTSDDRIRVLIKTDEIWLRRLPWQLWNFFEDYSQAEVALSAPEYESLPKLKTVSFKEKVKILAILGNSQGIFIEKDRNLLEILPDAEITFLVEPQRNQLNEQLWEQDWNILFFAGHSSSHEDGKSGNIYINQTDCLTIDELKYALLKAVSKGLQLAIFNSCDGLGLAHQLEDLHIPQIIVMREPVQDFVAQEFLKNFLKRFSDGESMYLAVRESREKLHGIEDKYPCAVFLPVICQNPAAVPPAWKDFLINPQIETSKPQVNKYITQAQFRWRSVQVVLLSSLIVTGLVMGVRSLGLLQSSELKAFDHLMGLRSEEKPDSRFLIITVDEADIQYQNRMKMNMRWSLSDQALAQLLKKLDQYQPRTIGLDIYRDFPVDSDNADLATRLAKDKRLFTVCKVSAALDGAPEGTPPAPEVPKERQSFSDFVADDNDIARRQLLHLTPPLTSPCAAEYSFSLQIALHYLETKGIKSYINPDGNLQIGNVVFKQLKSHTSGYQGVDASGYQILANYRSLSSFQNIAQQVSLRDVLNDRINSELIKLLKERIILIGVIAPTTTDYWKTPYSAKVGANQKLIPGVFVQAHMISQILSAVLDHRPLLWWWPTWVEVLWIWVWSLLGGILAWYIRHPVRLGVAGVIMLLSLFGICFGIFTQAGWIPFIPAALALIVTQLAVVSRDVHNR